jgi:hypothetical protein
MDKIYFPILILNIYAFTSINYSYRLPQINRNHLDFEENKRSMMIEIFCDLYYFVEIIIYAKNGGIIKGKKPLIKSIS